MSVRPIVLWPDPRLSEICAPVDDVAAAEVLIGDMFETMYAAPGRGLAAPQVGVMQRIFVMDATWKEGEMSPLACINPEIVALGGSSANEEACLSIPGVSAEVVRAAEIRLSYTDISGAPKVVELGGFAAICAQHEMDHLNGRVIFDHLNPEDRAALHARYEGMMT
ncbi:MAG: peptide deformylase [Pseudomonadota bacterium]